MIIKLSMNFVELSLDGKFYIEMINKYLRYKPEKLACKKKVTNWNEKKHKKVIEDLNSNEDFFFMFPTHHSFMANHVEAVKKRYQKFSICQDQEIFNPPNDEVENIIARQGFSCAYLFDYKYERQQSAISENEYLVYNIPVNLSKGLRYKKDEFGEKVFDISVNPGRQDWISSTGLMACWKMWFGEEFYSLVPKERLLSFKDAFKIEELPNNVVFVQLFENVKDSAGKNAQKAQWAWRKWLNFDDLIKRHP